MKVGIFGGTFNPPHKAHISIALAAKQQLGLDKLFVIPCGVPPHKSCNVDAETRLNLSRLAFPFAEVSDCEVVKQGKSYTVETLRQIKAVYPDAQLFLIVGGDSFAQFDTWFRPQEIASLATLAVVDRDCKTNVETQKRILRTTGAQAVFLNVFPGNASSTEVRLRYEFGLQNSQFVSTEVDQYILQHNLYCAHREMALKLRNMLSEKRFMHTFYVVKRGLELASEHNREKVFLACLLHDCAKYVSPADYAHYGFVLPDGMPEPVVHSFLGALVAQREFGICDREILDAIAYHTTGCPNMTQLQKIVYVADKTEETRSYPLSHLITGSLDEQFKKCLWEANFYTTANHSKIYPLTQETVDFYFPKK